VPDEKPIPESVLIAATGQRSAAFREVGYDEHAVLASTYLPLFETLNWAASIAEAEWRGRRFVRLARGRAP
jgi:hypothetical protein